MWKLTIVDDEGKQTVLPLSRGEYAVGRAEENTVRLTDRNISRKHLVLRRNDADDGWVVEDLNSYNGCFVNGERVSGIHPLEHGDVVQLGDYRLELADETRVARESAADAAQVAAAPPTARLFDRPDRLVVVDGAAAGTEYGLEGDRIVIGRAEDCDISINHSSVSRVHAEIVNLGEGQYEIFDRGSSNGVRVNGVKLERRVIEDDDELELGDVRLRFVARGRIFRPGTPSRSHSVAPTATASSPHRAQRRSNLGLMVLAGAVLGVVAIAAVVTLRPKEPVAAEPAVTAVAPEGTDIVNEAKSLAEAGQLDQAHDKLAQLPEGNALRDSREVRDIEARWAESLFARVDQEQDPDKRSALLKRIAGAPLLDDATRNRANDKLRQLDSEATSTADLPVASAKPASAPASVAAAPRDRGTPPPPAAGTPKTSNTTASAAPEAPPDANAAGQATKGRDGEERARRMLEPRVWAGKATIDEIKLLRAICRHQHDSACVSRCTALLKQKQQ